METEIPTYRAYWPEYVNEHRNKLNRNLHFAGTALTLAFLALGAFEDPWFLLGSPLAAYGLSWAGHRWAEKNRPTTFRYPLWNLMADGQMFFLMCVGRMDREVRRMGVFREAH